MAPGVGIRRAALTDLDAVVDLEARAGSVGWSRAQFREELTRADGHALIATVGDRVAGCAVGWAVAGEAQVLQIAVDPAQRRRGIGRRLLEALIDACGGGPALLEVRASNGAALGLYRAAGFVEVGRRPGYYPGGGDAVLMTREIR